MHAEENAASARVAKARLRTLRGRAVPAADGREALAVPASEEREALAAGRRGAIEWVFMKCLPLSEVAHHVTPPFRPRSRVPKSSNRAAERPGLGLGLPRCQLLRRAAERRRLGHPRRRDRRRHLPRPRRHRRPERGAAGAADQPEGRVPGVGGLRRHLRPLLALGRTVPEARRWPPPAAAACAPQLARAGQPADIAGAQAGRGAWDRARAGGPGSRQRKARLQPAGAATNQILRGLHRGGARRDGAPAHAGGAEARHAEDPQAGTLAARPRRRSAPQLPALPRPRRRADRPGAARAGGRVAPPGRPLRHQRLDGSRIHVSC